MYSVDIYENLNNFSTQIQGNQNTIVRLHTVL